jgi:putative transposase
MLAAGSGVRYKAFIYFRNGFLTGAKRISRHLSGPTCPCPLAKASFRLRGWSQWVDATPSNIKLLFKGGVYDPTGSAFCGAADRAMESLEGYGIEKSSVSRQFVEVSGNQLRALCERRLEDLKLVVLMIDGIHFGGQVLVVALGIPEGGEKHVLGVWQGATENTTVVKGLLEDLVERGLDLQRRYLVVIDGSKALRAGVERVFGEQVEVQRCQIHKRRNVKEYLPENCQKDYDRRMRNAYAMNDYAEAKEALQKIFRQLERINPSAARSLEEGLEETLTVHRLGVGAVLRRKLATTNPIESCLSTVQRVARNVKRWREGNQPLRWTATGLLEAEKKFRRIKGYQEILLLKERLNPSRLPLKEVRTLEVA